MARGGLASGLAATLLAALLAGCTAPGTRPSRGGIEDVVALKTAAETAYASEDWPAAEKAYRSLTEAVPAESENWFRLGNVYARLGRHYDAIALYREALVRDPANSRAWHNLGVTQLRLATNTFEELQAHTDPSDPVAERARRVVEAVSNLLQGEFAPERGEQAQ